MARMSEYSSVVTSLPSLIAITSGAIQPPPEALAGLSGKYLHGIARLGERLILVLDIGEVLNFTEVTAPALMSL